MCGIYGYFDACKNSISDEAFRKMGDVIEHRGPDGRGQYCNAEERIALGNQRLAILDVDFITLR